MFYLVKYKRTTWQHTNIILQGDIQKHLVVLSLLETQWGYCYRMKRISEETVKDLVKEGYVVLTAPDQLKDV